VIAFATLFLGLVAGPQPIELLVGSEVSAVVLAVDGETCAAIGAPPWRATCDFGPELEPRRLTAVGYGADGSEVARATQDLNVWRPAAEISLVIDRDPESDRLVVRVAARSVVSGSPRSLAVTLDGEPLEVADPARLDLPDLSLAEAHLIRVEAVWSDAVAARADAVFGGDYGERLSTQLSAVPVTLPKSDEKVADAFHGSILAGGRPLPVVALEKGPAEVWVVSALDLLPLPGFTAARSGGAAASRGQTGGLRALGQPSFQPTVGGAAWRFLGQLAGADLLRIVWPWPEKRVVSGLPIELFPPSPPFDSHVGGIPWLLYHARVPPPLDSAPHVADGAAVAGVSLLGSNRRRAVLVLVGGDHDDASRLDPDAVRHYLAAIRVPLFVWKVKKGRSDSAERWQPTVDVTTTYRLERALEELVETLDRQRIAWVEGAYLPTELAVSDQATPGLRAVASESVAPPDAAPVVVETDDDARRAELLAAVGERPARRVVGGVELVADREAAPLLARAEAVARHFADGWTQALGLARPQLAGALVALVGPRTGRDDPELERLGARGFAGSGTALVTVDPRDVESSLALLVHELSHLASERSFARPLPVWLEEGIAERLARQRLASNGRLIAGSLRGERRETREEGGLRIDYTGPRADLLALARDAGAGDLPRLEEWTSLSWTDFVAPAARARRYALAGSFVEFLFDASAERAAAVRAVLVEARDPAFEIEVALGERLGDVARLDAEFRRWLTTRQP